jgi:Spy/CpxP family protein refolding chaperone
LQVAHKDVADKLFAPGEVQTEDLTTQVQRVAQLREQLMQEGLKVALEVRGILTPEQLAKAADLKERMRALHAEMRGLFKDKH